MFVPSNLLLTYFISSKKETTQCVASALSLRPYPVAC